MFKTLKDQNQGFGSFLAGSLVGTSLEWYDFLVSSSAATLVWVYIYFELLPPAEALVFSLLAFSIGLVGRPFGALIFGYFADKKGRKYALMGTMVTMGLGTLFIGLLPTYVQIGLIAPVLLNILRFVQGIGLGGEWGNVNTWILEVTAKSKFRTLWGTMAQEGVPIGLISSSTFFSLLLTMPRAEFLSYGWRIAYYVGALAAVIGVIVRARLIESPLFKKYSGNKSRLPFVDLFKENPVKSMLLILVSVGLFSNFYIVLIAPDVMIDYGITAYLAELTVTAAGISAIFTNFGFTYLADRFGRKTIITISMIIIIIFSYPYWLLIISHIYLLVILAQVIALPVSNGGQFAVISIYYPELMPLRYRATGMGIPYQIAGILGGGIAPLLVASEISIYGIKNFIPYAALTNALYTVVSLAALMFLTETKNETAAELAT